MADFPFFKMAAIRHLLFLKVENFNFRSGSEAQYASSCQMLWRLVELFQRYGRFSIFKDGGRPPSWICFMRVGTTHEEYLVVFVTVQNMQILVFCTLSLKMPIYAPKIGIFGDFIPKMGSSVKETPKRHILGQKHIIWRIDRQNRLTFAGSSRAQE